MSAFQYRLHTQTFYTRTEADAQTSAVLLEKSGGKIVAILRTTRWHRYRNPGQNFRILANDVPLEAMRAFLFQGSSK